MDTIERKKAKAVFAQMTLASLGIPPGEDFHALSALTVQGLLLVADQVGYRRPWMANGSIRS